jgi:hypothetical protein
MKYYSFCSFLFLILFGHNAYSELPKIEPRFLAGAYAIECSDNTNPHHLEAVSFYEFRDDIKINEPNLDLLNTLKKNAPITFKNIQSDFSKIKIEINNINVPVHERIDPLVEPPSSCGLITMAQFKYGDSTTLEVNKKFWNNLNSKWQNYYLFEVFITRYLDQKLAASDFRRFDLYMASGEFNRFSDEQKKYFLKYHGINEFNYSGISIDLMREVINYQDSDLLKDAYPYAGATFEGAILDQKKFITFTKNKKIKSLATINSFSRIINGQKFDFYIPENEPPTSYPFDERYSPRINFFEDLSVESGYIKPIDHFYQLKERIKDSIGNHSYNKKFFEVRFYSDQNPQGLISYPGEVIIENKSFSTTISYWWPNQHLKEIYFSKRIDLVIQGKMIKDALGLFFDEDGQLTGSM